MLGDEHAFRLFDHRAAGQGGPHVRDLEMTGLKSRRQVQVLSRTVEQAVSMCAHVLRGLSSGDGLPRRSLHDLRARCRTDSCRWQGDARRTSSTSRDQGPSRTAWRLGRATSIRKIPSPTSDDTRSAPSGCPGSSRSTPARLLGNAGSGRLRATDLSVDARARAGTIARSMGWANGVARRTDRCDVPRPRS